MAADGTKTSFRQFEYCPLCKSSHKKRKKHVYSKHHQLILKNILNKFSSKIAAAKKDLFSPTATGDDFERNAKFWCYFCVGEFDKHGILEDCAVVGSGLLHHIASDEHKSSMEKFFWDNLLPKTLKPKYVLSKEDLYIFQRSSLLAVKKWQKAKRIEREKITSAIREVEIKRQIDLSTKQHQLEDSSIPHSSSVTDLPGNHLNGTPTTPITADQVLGRKLGLTRIKRNDEDESLGNVHTDAVPPWLQNDNVSDHTAKEIGPSMEDFKKHLETERKAKLPSIRVGAKFDHTSITSPEWLPSFGRVWSKGRRLQSKFHFEKEWKGKRLLTSKKEQGHKNGLQNSSHILSTTQEKSSSNGLNSRNKHSLQDGTNELESKQSTNYSELNNPKLLNSERMYFKEPNVTSSVINRDNVSIRERVGVTVVPYKRRKKDHLQDTNSAQLIQTPLLSQQR